MSARRRRAASRSPSATSLSLLDDADEAQREALRAEAERRRLVAELAARTSEANALKAKVAPLEAAKAQLRGEAERAAASHEAHTARLHSDISALREALASGEGEREAVERSLSDLRRSKLGVTLGPEHAAWRREELAGVIEAVGEVRSGLRQAQEECLAAELEAADGGEDSEEDEEQFISEVAIRQTSDLYSILDEQRLPPPKPPSPPPAADAEGAQPAPTRWELEYARGRAERQAEAARLELAQERRAGQQLQEELERLTTAGAHSLEGEPMVVMLRQQLAAALEENAGLASELQAARSAAAVAGEDGGAPTASTEMRLTTRQLAQARARLVESERQRAETERRQAELETELEREKERYDQLRLQVDELVIASTAGAASPRLRSPTPLPLHTGDALRPDPAFGAQGESVGSSRRRRLFGDNLCT